MNLIITSTLVLLFVLLSLVSQPPLIYGAHHQKRASLGSSNSHGPGNINESGSKHSMTALADVGGAHLFMEMQSGNILVRAARGASTSDANTDAVTGAIMPATAAADNVNAATMKRTKNNSSKKSQSHNGARKRVVKKFHNTLGHQHQLEHTPDQQNNRQQQQQQQQQRQRQRLHAIGKNKVHKLQRQMLKSHNKELPPVGATVQQPRKKSGIGKSKTNDNGEKVANGEKSPSTCRYAKSAWSDCDAKTNMRTRTLTLKKGEPNCLPTRTMQKKCKKACRYEKGAWSECNAGQMTRQDKLKSTGNSGSNGNSNTAPQEASCEPTRTIIKKCNPGGVTDDSNDNNNKHAGGRAAKERKHKDKGARRAPQA